MIHLKWILLKFWFVWYIALINTTDFSYIFFVNYYIEHLLFDMSLSFTLLSLHLIMSSDSLPQQHFWINIIAFIMEINQNEILLSMTKTISSKLHFSFHCYVICLIGIMNLKPILLFIEESFQLIHIWQLFLQNCAKFPHWLSLFP